MSLAALAPHRCVGRFIIYTCTYTAYKYDMCLEELFQSNRFLKHLIMILIPLSRCSGYVEVSFEAPVPGELDVSRV